MISQNRRIVQKTQRATLVLVAGFLLSTIKIYASPSDGEDSQTLAPIFRTVNKTAQASSSIQATLMRELKLIRTCESHKKGVIEVSLVDDNIKEWNVKIFIQEGPLLEGLQKIKEMGREDHIMLRVSFPESYPVKAPFVRVVYPVINGLNQFGSLCMELLTPHGWNSSFNSETLIVSILSFLLERKISVEIDPERITGELGRYSESDARDEFEQNTRAHGWQNPPKERT